MSPRRCRSFYDHQPSANDEGLAEGCIAVGLRVQFSLPRFTVACALERQSDEGCPR